MQTQLADRFQNDMMQSSIDQKTDRLVVSGFLLVLGIVYFTLQRDGAIPSLLMTLSFPCVLLTLIRQYKRRRIATVYLGIIVSSTCLVFINVMLSGFGGFDYYKKAIMYITTLVWLVCCNAISISKRTLLCLFGFHIVCMGLYAMFFRNGFEVVEDEIFLTLNFSNPNLAGMFLVHSLLYAGIFMVNIGDLIEKKKWRLTLLGICLPFFFNTINLLFLTGNRSSVMAFLLFVGLIVSDLLFPYRFWLKKKYLFLLAMFPFLFVFIYIAYAGKLGNHITFGMVDHGKTNTTRNHVWLPIINDFWHYFLSGDYSGISKGTGKSQLHNTHLDVYASYGILPLVLYVYLLFKLMSNALCITNTRLHRSGLYAFMAVFAVCCFEAGLVAGSFGLFIFTGGFLLIAHYKPQSRPLQSVPKSNNR